MKKFVTLLLQLLLICFLLFVAREAWTAYEQEKLNMLFATKAILVRIQVNTINAQKKTWKDYVGNSKYIDFGYHNGAYQLHILQNSGLAGAGSCVLLQYHPIFEQFRQPGIPYLHVSSRQASKLINWTILSIASPANQILFTAVTLTFIIILMGCSILVNITDQALFKIISRVLVTVFLIGADVFAT